MRLNSLAVSVFLLCAAFPAAAEGEGGLRDFDFVKGATPGLTLSNPAALAAWGGKISTAAVSFDKENGGLASLTQSKDSYEIGAGTESFYRISDRIVFHGRINWSYFNGKGMGGPLLLDPDYNPVNFLEIDTTTAGPKHKESYSLAGGMSYSFNDRWAAGVGFDFGCKDYTKVKDPRYTSYWTDLSINAGVSFRPSDKLLFGASVFYRNTLEQILGGKFGKTDKQHFIATDKGGYYGTVSELVEDRNHISVKSRRPMDNTFIGGSLQAVVGGCFTNEVSFAMRDGYFGRKSTSSPLFFEFSGIEVRYDGAYLISAGSDIHRISLSAGYATLGNDENIFNYVTPTGEVTRVEYTGVNHISDRSVIDGTLGYRWYRGIDGQRPDFTLGADITFFSKAVNTQIYPFYRDHDFTRIDADIFGRKDFRKGRNIFTPELHAQGHFGSGTAKADGQYAAGTSKTLKSFDYWLGRQFEFETALRAGAAIGFTYQRVFSRNFAPYVKVMDSFMTMFADAEYLTGKTRNVATLTVGCTF